ncbi:efflux RND transporter periplasmic adaptor subunit [uncultured Ferrimonas sp.]|uniref:efflux RND transporter periplasmic adaptor subunit n=1 Tax=uncultured Ferrimonas sp. TaxID=432640 RepID=UPI00262BCAEA|nr:efflux RND transporter periplasmic adaptor subunit [uncultured Ferrimonas sp.]
MNKWLMVIGMAVLWLLAGCEQPPQQQQGFPPPQVGVMTVASAPLQLSSILAGRTHASLEAEVRPQVSGILLQQLFTEGAEVTQGQQLYQIDPATYQAELARAEADLSKARANLKSAKAKAERYQILVSSKAVSKQDYDDAEAQYEQAQADVNTAQAAKRSATINLEYTKVYAPISGRAGKSGVTAGALVTANQSDALVTVQQFDPMYVDVSESSGELHQLRRAWASGEIVHTDADGANVSLYFDSGEKYGRVGAFKFADINVNPSTGTFTIRTTFPNPDGELLPGMFVRAELVKGTKQDAILIPAKGVSRTATGEASVMLVGADNVVEQRTVEVSQMIGSSWLLQSGLSNGDRVILEGLQFVRPGAPVGGVQELKQ